MQLEKANQSRGITQKTTSLFEQALTLA